MRITSVEPVLLKGDDAYRASAGGEEATDNGDWQLLVRVATDEGLEGWADVETLGPAAVTIISGPGMGVTGFKALGELLIGEDPRHVERLWDKLYVGSAYYGRRGIAMQCISAIDNCLWSIRAQAAGVSLATLLGGARRDRVTAYASTLFRETPEGMAQAARDYVEKGFKAVKFGWGVFGEDSGRDRELVAAAREALGPDRDLLVDPGQDRCAAAATRSRCANGWRIMASAGWRISSTPNGSTNMRRFAPSARRRSPPASRSRRSGSSSVSSGRDAST
ncbi:MAG: hypothetical protein J0H41_04515 [Rhizobiales bacterium]|nr:hypothetical protein [Hyphomicrobiales bacterium]